MAVRTITGIIEGEPPTESPCKIYLTIGPSDYEQLGESLANYHGFKPLFENAYAKKVALYMPKLTYMPELTRGCRYDVEYVIMKRKVQQQYSNAAKHNEGTALTTNNHALGSYAGDGIHCSLTFVIRSIRPAVAEANLRVAAGVAIVDMSKH